MDLCGGVMYAWGVVLSGVTLLMCHSAIVHPCHDKYSWWWWRFKELPNYLFLISSRFCCSAGRATGDSQTGCGEDLSKVSFAAELRNMGIDERGGRQ